MGFPSESAREAFELLDELSDLLDEIEDIDAAEDYVESVRESSSDMRKWVDREGFATDKQITAICNWIDGARRWQR